MKRLFSIAILNILLISSLSLTLQYLYQAYLCEDKVEFLEVAGRKITVCGKVCSLDDLKSPEQKSPQTAKYQYKTEVPPLFLSVQESDRINLCATNVTHLSGEFCFYQFHWQDELIDPPGKA
ncbi:MAG: hypothetical protein ABJ004_02975 [Cyclobacteriaceae bacterium]